MKSSFDGMMITLLILFLILIGIAFWLGISKEWMIALFTATLSILGWIYSNAKNAQREIEARLFSEKAALYKKVFGLFPKQLKKVKSEGSKLPQKKKDDTATDEHRLMEELLDIKSELLIWGSEDTIAAWVAMEDSSDDNNADPVGMILNWGELYLQMRTDLGHSDVQISAKDLIGFFLTTEARKELPDN